MTRLPKQIYVLLGAAILLGFLLRQVNRQTTHINGSLIDAELILGIPSIPNLAGWPKEFFSELKRVHEAFNSPDGRMEALASLGELYFSNGFYGEANQCFSALIKIQPDNARWPYFLGLVTRDYQDKSVAIESLERALALDSSYMNIRYVLGLAYLEAGHILDSITHFEILAERALWGPWARYGLSKGLMLEERYEEANDQIDLAIQGDSRVREFYSLQEELSLYSGNLEKAEVARIKKELLSYEKKPYDPWVQGLWESCYDVFRLVKFAESEALVGNRETAIRIQLKAKSISGGNEVESVETDVLDELLRDSN